MKKLFVLFLIVINYPIFCQDLANVYFDYPINGHTYSSQNGKCRLDFRF